MYDLHSKFDVQQHASHFVNYCEVVILEDGTISYAVPSHTQFLENYGTKKFGPNWVETCPQDMWFDYLTWLIDETGVVCCWSVGYRAPRNKKLTDQQSKSLELLFSSNLVKRSRM